MDKVYFLYGSKIDVQDIEGQTKEQIIKRYAGKKLTRQKDGGSFSVDGHFLGINLTTAQLLEEVKNLYKHQRDQAKHEFQQKIHNVQETYRILCEDLESELEHEFQQEVLNMDNAEKKILKSLNEGGL